MPDPQENDDGSVLDARMKVMSVERLYNDLRRRRSIIDTATMIGALLLIAAVVVLTLFAWARVIPPALLMSASITIVIVVVMSLAVRGLALWRYSVSVGRTADMVGEWRRNLEVDAMRPTPLQRAREGSAEVLADADLDGSVLLSEARDFRERLWNAVMSRESSPDAEDPAGTLEWRDARSNLDDAYDSAARMLHQAWEETAAQLRAADKRATALLEHSRPDVSVHSARVAMHSTRVLARANAEAKERVLDAQRTAAFLLHRAEDDALGRLGFVLQAGRSGRTESAGEHE